MIQIYCKNTKTTKNFTEGTSLQEMLPHFTFDQPFQIISAKVNNVSQGLKFRVFTNKDVEFLDAREASGLRVYCRSLCFLLYKAANDIFPNCRLFVELQISGGLFCNLHKADGSPLTKQDIQTLSSRMTEIVNKDMVFHRYQVQREEALRIFRDRGYDDKVKLLETSGQVYTDYYTLGDTVDYYYGRLVPSASYLKVWKLQPFHNGFLLRIPDKHNPNRLSPFIRQPKGFSMFTENLRWNIIMGLNTVGDVNHSCQAGHARELIQVAEALQEKKIVQIAESIDRRFHSEKPVRLVLITGPSSSGKTTFCRRLSIQLKACGLRPLSLSTDDYFVNRVETPRLPNGQYDFDNFDTVDHEKLQDDLVALMHGKTVEVPEYNFTTGKREYNGKKLNIEGSTVILLEGLHALNPELTSKIPDEYKYRIFINTLTNNALDNHNWIPTSDNRLLRRIVRDYNNNSFTATETIRQWPSVLDAEEKWIYPYMENADAMFNSAYLLEFVVLRSHAEPILATVPQNCPEYSEAHRLLTFIHYFTAVSDKEIPSTSLLREFLGGSSFNI